MLLDVIQPKLNDILVMLIYSVCIFNSQFWANLAILKSLSNSPSPCPFNISPLSHISGNMLALSEIHPLYFLALTRALFAGYLYVFKMFTQLSTSVTPFSQDHYCKCNSGPNNTLQYHVIPHFTRQYQAIPRIQ